MEDLTIIYVTANVISNYFAKNLQKALVKAAPDTGIISISKKSIDFGVNIVTPGDRCHVGIYRDALLGAKTAQTKYIAFVEDDTLYAKDHFLHRPSSGKFAYNVSCWSLFTWSDPPIFSWRGRRNNNGLICERELFIEAMEERFRKYPTDDLIDNRNWAEPGKYESILGVTVRATETFYTNVANIMFSHPSGLSYQTIGERKRLGELRAIEIPYWGRAEQVRKLYE